jgi:hypothetical protein
VIFAAFDGDLNRLHQRAHPNFTRGVISLGAIDLHVEPAAAHRDQDRQRHHARFLIGLRDRVIEGSTIAAEHMRDAVDHDLRRIDLPVAAHMGIGALARRMRRIGERVLPAEIIPIVDRHAERDERRIGGEFADKLIGGGTGRAALAGEEFDEGARLAGLCQACLNCGESREQ